MNSPRIIVLGSLNLDLVIRGPRLPRPGETVIGGEFFQAFGGKGANKAVAAAHVSTSRVGLVGAVGADRYGDEYLEYLRDETIDVSYVGRNNQPTGVAMILVQHDGENLISVASGANAQLSVADVDALDAAWIGAARVWLTNLECPVDTVEQGLRRAKEAGLTTILNPAPMPSDAAPVLDRLLSLVDVLVPNRVETQALVGTFESPENAAGNLHARGAAASVITLGAEGCLVSGADGAKRLPAHDVQAVDATGAGDAFCGALAAGLADGLRLLPAASLANAAAAVSVTRLGAQPSLPTREQVQRLLAYT